MMAVPACLRPVIFIQWNINVKSEINSKRHLSSCAAIYFHASAHDGGTLDAPVSHFLKSPSLQEWANM